MGRKLTRKRLIVFLSLCSAIIFIASLEVLFIVKSEPAYNIWLQQFANTEANLSSFVGLNLMLYFSKILVPMVFSFYVLFTFKKAYVNGLFIFLWTVLILGNLAFSIIGKSLANPILWINVVLYGVLIFGILTIKENQTQENENK